MTTINETQPGSDAIESPIPPTTSSEAVTDLSSRSAVHDLVVSFYRELVFDELLAPVFEEVAEVDWALHIPLLIDYWVRILLGQEGYQGAILAAHQHVHDRQAFTAEHFDRWYSLWVMTIDARWSGAGAEKAKRHAAKIAATLARRLLAGDWAPPMIPRSAASMPARGLSDHQRDRHVEQVAPTPSETARQSSGLQHRLD